MGRARKPTRHIINVGSLKDVAHHIQLTYKGKILILLEKKLTVQSFKAPIPHGNWRESNTKRNTKISHNNTKTNKIPSGKNCGKGLTKTNQPKVNLVITDLD